MSLICFAHKRRAPAVWLGFYKNQISFLKESYSALILRARRSKDRAFYSSRTPHMALRKPRTGPRIPRELGFVADSRGYLI